LFFRLVNIIQQMGYRLVFPKLKPQELSQSDKNTVHLVPAKSSIETYLGVRNLDWLDFYRVSS
jgi:hypothetical protein